MKKFSGNKASFGEMISIKPPMKGGHRHNHARNVLERKLNKSRSSRKRWLELAEKFKEAK